jgi:dihydroflavonol-4-reductase
MSETVLLTGVSGFIAKHVALRLLDAGHRVRGTLRDLSRAGEVRAALRPALRDAGALERLDFVALDLTRDEGWAGAAAGATVIVHTASPFPISQPKDEAELIRPAVEGTLRALRAARAAGVGRVVLTSSSVAIVNRPLPPGRDSYDETDWSDVNAPTATPYVKSKTLAERAAWDFVAGEGEGIALTVINPGFVVGPPLDDHFGSSVGVVRRILSGKDPASPRFGLSVVDVRDVAEMHLRAVERPDLAGGRYPAVAGAMWFPEMAQVLKAAYPQRRIATRVAPRWLLRILALFDGEIRAILPAIGKIEAVSNRAAVARIGMRFIPPDEGLRAAAAYLVARKLV